MGSMLTRYYAFALGSKNPETDCARTLGLATIAYIFITGIAIAISVWMFFSIDIWFGNSFSLDELVVARQMMFVVGLNMAIFIPGSMFAAIINAEERFVFAQTMNLIRAILQPAAIIAVVQFQSNALAIVVVQFLLNLITVIINAFYCFYKIRIKFIFGEVNRGKLREMLAFLGFALLGLVFDQILWRTDQVIIGALFGTATVAIYSVGTTIVAAYIMFSNSVANILLPKVSKMIASGASDGELSILFARVGRIQTWIVSFIEVGFILFGLDFVHLWAGADYTDAYAIVLIFMAGMHLALTQNLGQAILQGKNKQGFKSVVYIFIAIANVIISILASLQFGYIACAWSSMICLLIGTGPIINWYYSKNIGLNIRYFFFEVSKMLPSILATLAVFVLLRHLFVFSLSWANLLIWIVCFTITYIFVTFKWGLYPDESNAVRAFLESH
jgi:O-antigen/teichoic acid export membrane protein